MSYQYFFLILMTVDIFCLVDRVHLISEPDLSKCALLIKTTLSLNQISVQTPIEPFGQYPIRGDYMKLSLAFYLLPCILERK